MRRLRQHPPTKRTITSICLLLVMLLGFGLYHTKYAVMEMEQKLYTTHQQILKEQSTLRVLAAEWQYLTSPTMLEKRYIARLKLKKVIPMQVVNIESLSALNTLKSRPTSPKTFVSYRTRE